MVSRVMPARERVAVLLEVLGMEREVEVSFDTVIVDIPHPMTRELPSRRLSEGAGQAPHWHATITSAAPESSSEILGLIDPFAESRRKIPLRARGIAISWTKRRSPSEASLAG